MSDHSGGGEAPQASTKWRCKHCHHEDPNTQRAFKFCPECGEKQSEEAETKKAGSQPPIGNQTSSENVFQNPDLHSEIPTKPDTDTTPRESKDLLQNVPDLPDPHDLSTSGATNLISSDELVRERLGERKRSRSFSNKESSTAVNTNDSSEPAGPSSVQPFHSPQLKRRTGAQDPETFAKQLKKAAKRIQVHSISPISSPDSKRRKKSTENSQALQIDKEIVDHAQENDAIQQQRKQAVIENASEKRKIDPQQNESHKPCPTNQQQGNDQDSGNENQTIGSDGKQQSHDQGEDESRGGDSDQIRKVGLFQ